MKYIAKLIFWVAPEHREAKLAYIMGARSLTALIKAVGPSKELIKNTINKIMAEMGMNEEAVIRAIAKMWSVKITIERS
jgi:hypothetical protein